LTSQAIDVLLQDGGRKLVNGWFGVWKTTVVASGRVSS